MTGGSLSFGFGVPSCHCSRGLTCPPPESVAPLWGDVPSLSLNIPPTSCVFLCVQGGCHLCKPRVLTQVRNKERILQDTCADQKSQLQLKTKEMTAKWNNKVWDKPSPGRKRIDVERQKEMSVDLQAQPRLPGQVSAYGCVQLSHPAGF
ncbi:hypothetical protein PAL_GLEAN10002454 [Pteropus alecto]|uniref:Uncharacterized protein n=1 Tax=Pteropus alecto TaxID=9402 RepID=L5L3P5_PTEAL|nr:hypothetical protein PAL_GLEAN10002454 [Pteropus alecto]